MVKEDKKLVGKVIHYYNKIEVAIIEILDKLEVGDMISIEGPNTNFKQKVDSMQIEHKNVDGVKKGDVIGLKVVDKAKEKDQVFKLLTPIAAV